MFSFLKLLYITFWPHKRKDKDLVLLKHIYHKHIYFIFPFLRQIIIFWLDYNLVFNYLWQCKYHLYLSHKYGPWVMWMLVSQSCLTLWPFVAHQAPLSVGFFRQQYWSGLPSCSSRGSSQPRDWICVSYVFCAVGGFWILNPWGLRIEPSGKPRKG